MLSVALPLALVVFSLTALGLVAAMLMEVIGRWKGAVGEVERLRGEKIDALARASRALGIAAEAQGRAAKAHSRSAALYMQNRALLAKVSRLEKESADEIL